MGYTSPLKDTMIMHDYVPSRIEYMILQNGVYISIEGYYDYA
jgi:hypothetical protein